jgi:hypothetical protein
MCFHVPYAKHGERRPISAPSIPKDTGCSQTPIIGTALGNDTPTALAHKPPGKSPLKASEIFSPFATKTHGRVAKTVGLHFNQAAMQHLSYHNHCSN